MPEHAELISEPMRSITGIQNALALNGFPCGNARAPERYPSGEQADSGCRLSQALKPSGVGAVVNQNARLRDLAGLNRLNELPGETLN